MFDAMAREFEKRGIAFEVYFMARTVPIRSWEFTPSEWHFVHHFGGGIHWTRGSTTFHLNPSVVYRIVRDNPRWLLVGGGWLMPTSIALIGARTLTLGGTTLLWSEANRASMSFRTGIVHDVRQAIATRVDAVAVPGKIAAETVRDDWGLKDMPLVPLPNLIDEGLFGARVAELRARRSVLRQSIGVSGDDFLVLWPARLDERTKGLLNFLRAIEGSSRPGVRILIAGEGPDRHEIESWLASSSISGVTLLGWQREERMLELYASSDLFLLPSIRDPNPLSVIEALWAGLPLLISDRCGNWPEAIEPGVNGWVVDPTSQAEMRRAFEAAMQMTPQERARAGAVSASIAREKFSTQASVTAFADSLMRV
jgi:glycosyltransferase involved in cell wall biosynthesis